jgi:hypothetical protein
MKSKAELVLFCLLSFSAAGAQESAKHQLIVPLAEGGFVAFRNETAWANAAQPSKQVKEMQGEFGSQALVDRNNVIHRVLMDTAGRFIFGYDLSVAPNPALKKFRIEVKPLDPRFEDGLKARSSDQSETKISTLPKSSEPQVLDDGDAFSLDLLVNQTAGVKIVDIVKVSFDRSQLWDTNPKTLPRDFTLDEVELKVKDFRLLVDGNVVAAGKPGSSVAGALIWFYLQDRGRFIFSLAPRDGYHFQKVGIIKDNKIEFTVDGKYYEWLSSTPILRAGGTWNLWVLHDPKYAPFGSGQVEKKKEPNKWDKLDASIRAAQDKAARAGDPTPSTFHNKTNSPNNQSNKQPRVMVGGADRIENLWPK